MSDEKRVRVRVAVAVDPFGNWSAAGLSVGAGDVDEKQPDSAPRPDDESADDARQWVHEGEVVYFITAELPIPVRTAPEDVAATIEEPAHEPV